MVAQVIALCTQVVTAVNGWIVDIFEATDAVSIYIGLVVVLMTFRFLFAPVFGQNLHSDIARATKDRQRMNTSRSENSG